MITAIDGLWGSLHPKIRETLDKRGFDGFSEIQIRAVPKLIRGDNVVLIAPTGTGKIECALFPIFHRMLTESHLPEYSTRCITPLHTINCDRMNRLACWGN
jgi:ATP-dependent Lhr-like helicase